MADGVATDVTGEGLRVLAWPAEGNRTGNPYNALLARHLRALGATVDEFTPRRLLRGRYDVWHAHWPDGVMGRRGAARAAAGAAALLALAAAARARGTRLVWTVHNLQQHDGRHPRVERTFWQAWTRLVNASIHLSASGRAAALERFPALRRQPALIVPHGHYREAYPAPVEKAEARARLGLEGDVRVTAFVGHIRPYKGAPTLVRLFRGVPDADARLVVAGQPATATLARELRAAAAGDGRVLLRLDHVPDAEIPAVVGAADLVALPYTDVLNSGSALLALSLDRPVLVPARGAMAELREAVGADWVAVYDGPLTSARLAAALADAAKPGRPRRVPLDGFGWERLAARTLDAYRAALASRAR